MRIADLAQELKITEEVILAKLKTLKLRAKENHELNMVVEIVLRDEFAKQGIVSAKKPKLPFLPRGVCGSTSLDQKRFSK